MAFGHGYWITVTENITLYLKGASETMMAPEVAMQSPPATYYGPVLAGTGFAPSEGMTVTAWIDGHLCGRSQTLDIDGQVMCAINVFAEGPGDWAGCGTTGRLVRLYVEGPKAAQNDWFLLSTYLGTTDAANVVHINASVMDSGNNLIAETAITYDRDDYKLDLNTVTTGTAFAEVIYYTE